MPDEHAPRPPMMPSRPPEDVRVEGPLPPAQIPPELSEEQRAKRAADAVRGGSEMSSFNEKRQEAGNLFSTISRKLEDLQRSGFLLTNPEKAVLIFNEILPLLETLQPQATPPTQAHEED